MGPWSVLGTGEVGDLGCTTCWQEVPSGSALAPEPIWEQVTNAPRASWDTLQDPRPCGHPAGDFHCCTEASHPQGTGSSWPEWPSYSPGKPLLTLPPQSLCSGRRTLPPGPSPCLLPSSTSECRQAGAACREGSLHTLGSRGCERGARGPERDSGRLWTHSCRLGSSRPTKLCADYPAGPSDQPPSSFGFRSPLICALVGHTVGKANTQRAQGF